MSGPFLVLRGEEEAAPYCHLAALARHHGCTVIIDDVRRSLAQLEELGAHCLVVVTEAEPGAVPLAAALAAMGALAVPPASPRAGRPAVADAATSALL